MAELGRFSRKSHFSLGRSLAQADPDCLILVGPEKETVREGARSFGLPAGRILRAKDNQTAVSFLREKLRPGAFVLLKGSRFLKLEEIVEQFMIQ